VVRSIVMTQVASQSSKVAWIPVLCYEASRGKDVYICLYLPAPPPNCYLVVVTYLGKPYAQSLLIDWAAAEYTFSEESILPGPGGSETDSSWCAVLSRLMHNVEPAGTWQGSIGEHAAKYYDVGSWPWVESLRLYRKLAEEKEGGV
jgi:hypothetical protein